MRLTTSHPASQDVTSPGATGRRSRADVRRINFRFSGRGRFAACLADHGSRRLQPEVWDLTGTTPRPRTLRTRHGQTMWTAVVPTDDGRVLLCRRDSHGARHLVLTVPAPDGDGVTAEEHRLAVVRSGALMLVGSPAPGSAALALRITADRRTTVWRVSGRAEPPDLVVRLPDPLAGGVWLEESGERLALTRRRSGTDTVVLDLTRGALAPLAGLADDEHLVLAAPRTGILLTAAFRAGAYRLGVRHRDDDRPTAFPDRLNAIEGGVTPLALDPAGRRLALAVTRGARSHLLLHDLAEDTTSEVRLLPGRLHATARWTDTGLHLIHGTPHHPAGPTTVSGPFPPGVPPARRHRRKGRETARVHDFEGPAGRVEAVVHGDPVTSSRVVLALHGGPEAAWRLDFDPLFRRLAASDIAVVAPNQRGSTGYGPAHRDAIRGAWGGPDLADTVHLGRALASSRVAGRPRPMLYGVSYGAYLALLAAAAEPDLWDRAAVVAPFLSGRLLHEDGPTPVRTLIDRLGGREEIHDDLGPRDLLRLAGRIRLPLLVVHGDQDQVIPVTHSRRLRDRLRETGHRHGLTYLELPGVGHDPLSDVDGHAVRDRVVDFLRAPPPTPG